MEGSKRGAVGEGAQGWDEGLFHRHPPPSSKPQGSGQALPSEPGLSPSGWAVLEG